MTTGAVLTKELLNEMFQRIWDDPGRMPTPVCPCCNSYIISAQHRDRVIMAQAAGRDVVGTRIGYG